LAKERTWAGGKRRGGFLLKTSKREGGVGSNFSHKFEVLHRGEGRNSLSLEDPKGRKREKLQSIGSRFYLRKKGRGKNRNLGIHSGGNPYTVDLMPEKEGRDGEKGWGISDLTGEGADIRKKRKRGIVSGRREDLA